MFYYCYACAIIYNSLDNMVPLLGTPCSVLPTAFAARNHAVPSALSAKLLQQAPDSAACSAPLSLSLPLFYHIPCHSSQQSPRWPSSIQAHPESLSTVLQYVHTFLNVTSGSTCLLECAQLLK